MCVCGVAVVVELNNAPFLTAQLVLYLPGRWLSKLEGFTLDALAEIFQQFKKFQISF